MTTNINLLTKLALPHTRTIVACCLAVRLANKAIDHYLKDAYPPLNKVLKGVAVLFALTTMPKSNTLIALLALANLVEIIRNRKQTPPQTYRRRRPNNESLAIDITVLKPSPRIHILYTRNACIRKLAILMNRVPKEYEPYPGSIELAADITHVARNLVTNHRHYDVILARNLLILAATFGTVSNRNVEMACKKTLVKLFGRQVAEQLFDRIARQVNRIKPGSMQPHSNVVQITT